MKPSDPDSHPREAPTAPKVPSLAGENDDLAKILKERVEAQRKIKKKEYEAISKKSFLLRAQDSSAEDQPEIRQLEGSISQLMKEQRRKDSFLREVDSSPFYSLDRLNYFIHKNPMLFTSIFLETNLMILSYPLQTMKTRVQSRHIKYDLCHYTKNAVEKAPMHFGIGYAYLQTITANVFHYFTTKYCDYFLLKHRVNESYLVRKLLSFTAADVISSPFRLIFEIRKNLKQMNVQEITFGKQASAFRLALLPYLLKDVLFRLTFETYYHSCVFYDYYSKLRGQRMLGMQVEDTLGQQLQFEASRKIHQRSGLFISGVILASLVTHPLDLVATRLIIQQKEAYSGMLDCVRTIIREEGAKKLWFSGLGPRAAFFMLQGSLMMALTPRILPVIEEAYSLENIIN